MKKLSFRTGVVSGFAIAFLFTGLINYDFDGKTVDVAIEQVPFSQQCSSHASGDYTGP